MLNIATNKSVSRSNVRPADDPTSPNPRIDPLTAPKVFTSRHIPSVHLNNDEEALAVTEDEAPNASTSSPKHIILILDSHNLVGRTFIILQEDGQLLRARIVKAIDDHDGKPQRDSTSLKFIFSTKYDTVEDAFT